MISLLKEGNNEAFDFLIDEYQKKIYWLIRKMVVDHDDANDLTQEVFIKVYRKISGFEESSTLFTWLYKIASNEALDFLRKKKKRFFIPIQDVTAELQSLISENMPGAEEVEIRFHKALLTVPDQQRLVFNMRYFDDLSFKQIAEILDKSEGGLKANYHHAVNKIKKALNLESLD